MRTARSTAVLKFILAATIEVPVTRRVLVPRRAFSATLYTYCFNMPHDAPCPRPFKVYQHLAQYFDGKKGQNLHQNMRVTTISAERPMPDQCHYRTSMMGDSKSRCFSFFFLFLQSITLVQARKDIQDFMYLFIPNR